MRGRLRGQPAKPAFPAAAGCGALCCCSCRPPTIQQFVWRPWVRAIAGQDVDAVGAGVHLALPVPAASTPHASSTLMSGMACRRARTCRRQQPRTPDGQRLALGIKQLQSCQPHVVGVTPRAADTQFQGAPHWAGRDDALSAAAAAAALLLPPSGSWWRQVLRVLRFAHRGMLLLKCCQRIAAGRAAAGVRGGTAFRAIHRQPTLVTVPLLHAVQHDAGAATAGGEIQALRNAGCCYRRWAGLRWR